MEPERILYPCYFKSSLKRKEGRRISKKLAVENPSTKEIGKALDKMRAEYRVEDASHPAQWAAGEGRVVVMWPKSKEKLIKEVARRLREK